MKQLLENSVAVEIFHSSNLKEHLRRNERAARFIYLWRSMFALRITMRIYYNPSKYIYRRFKMAGWSSTLRALGQNIVKYQGLAPIKLQSNGAVRSMSDHGPRVFPLVPSRWQWNRTKDLFHFYTMLGLIPIGIVITGSYIFVGPATLQEIPEGYTPKHWEYYRNPITRFISRYLRTSHQQEYEKVLHALWEESEKMKLRELEKKIKALMEERRDYQAYYYRPAIAKYYRRSRDARAELGAIQGD